MEIVEERYGRGSTMTTSQLPIKAWQDVFGEPTFADAILDRIVHNAHRLELKGASKRKTIGKMDDETPQICYPKKLPYGNASQVVECVGTGGRM